MKELFFPFCFNDFISSNTLSLNFALSWLFRTVSFSNMKELLITAFPRQLKSVVKCFWNAPLLLWLVRTIHIILFKFVFIDNRYQFMDTKTPSNEDSSALFSIDIAPPMTFITALFCLWIWSSPISENWNILEILFWKVKHPSMKDLCSCGEFWGRGNIS